MLFVGSAAGGMQAEEVRYESYNADGEYQVLVVSYGTMSRVCRTAIDQLKEQGLEVAMLRPKTLFPFPEQAVETAASKNTCRVVASIEMSMGQMMEDVQRAVKGKLPVSWYGKCGGEVPTPEEVIEFIKSLATA